MSASYEDRRQSEIMAGGQLITLNVLSPAAPTPRQSGTQGTGWGDERSLGTAPRWASVRSMYGAPVLRPIIRSIRRGAARGRQMMLRRRQRHGQARSIGLLKNSSGTAPQYREVRSREIFDDIIPPLVADIPLYFCGFTFEDNISKTARRND